MKYGMSVRSGNRAAAGSAGRRGRGRPRVDDKRRRILDAALTVFATRGFHGTSVPEVATAAGVGIGTLYRYFEHKEALVNDVYRDAKGRLAAALFGGAGAPGTPATGARRATTASAAAGAVAAAGPAGDAQAWFTALWAKLAAFARAEPDAFRFLELQDHAPYLDAASRRLELSVLGPLWIAGKRLRGAAAGAPVDVLMALVWGAFVGLVKADRLGYLALDDARLAAAGEACWRMIAPAPARAAAARRRARPPVRRPRPPARARKP
jgi:AcrR family transcriptional regulator